MIKKEDKIIVVGAGISGLSTVIALVRKGYTDIHLFDKRNYIKQKYSYFDECDSPSSDLNKFFRTAYGSEVYYQDMAIRSQTIVRQWNKQIKEENWEGGDPILIEKGNLFLTDNKELDEFGKATLKTRGDGKIIVLSDPRAREKAMAHGLYPCVADPFGLKKQGKTFQGIIDVEAGNILADKACRWMLYLAKRDGGSRLTLHLGKSIGEVDHLLEKCTSTGKKNVGICTKDGRSHYAPLTIVCAGPWLTELVPESQERVEATAGSVALVKITDPKLLAKYDESKFPIWSWKTKDAGIAAVFGFPVSQGWMKIGFRGLKWTNPQPGLNSKIITKWSSPETETNIPLFALNSMKLVIKKFLPEIKKIDLTRMCWYGDTEDNNWLIDYSPYHEDNSLFVVGGDSGHLFKMLAVIGDIIVDLLNNKGDTFLADLFSWSRKREKKNIINKGLDDPRALQNVKMASPKDWYIFGDSKL